MDSRERTSTATELEREIDEIRSRLQEAQEELRAIREGEIDALVLHADSEEVFTLERPVHSFRMLVEQMAQAAAAVTTEGTVLCCNERFGSLVRRPTTSITGRRLRDLVASECHDTLDAMLAKAPSGDAEAVLILQLEDAALPVPFCLQAIGTSAFGLGLLLTDLTETKRFEELERAQAALRESEEALRQADRKKDEFLATLAHELRNPLAPMRNAVEFLRAKGTSVPDLRWAHDVIDRQVQLMARLLDDLLDVSRVALDRPGLRRTRVELADVVNAAVETSLPLIERAGHELAVTLPPEPIYLDADPVRLAQVFANLLNNAAKYTDEGGRIQIVAEQRDHEVVVSVSDTGIGIAPELLPQVFDIFSQAKPAMGRSQGGLGIGLSLVKGLVELHGGSVEAVSDGVGRGSLFSVRLPVADGTRAASGARAPHREASVPQARRRVLVVDDRQDSADSLSMLLRAMGHEAQTAYDAERALELARTMLPELILLDLGMPRVDGYETCRRIRSEPWGERVRVVALTGWGQEQDRRKSRAAGFDHHLVKPVDMDQLDRLLAALEGPTATPAGGSEPARRGGFPGDANPRTARKSSDSAPTP